MHKRANSKWIWIAAMAVACAVILCGVGLVTVGTAALVVTVSHTTEPSASVATTTGTEPALTTTTSATTVTTAPAVTTATQPTVPTLPTALQGLLDKNGYTAADLEARGCEQIVTVSNDSGVAIRFFEKLDGQWTERTTLSCSGFVGINGVAVNRKEGSGSTPCGLYAVGDAFYIYDRPQTALNTFHITEDTYWVDDPDSAYYNQRVEGTANKDWDSAEHMIDYGSYIYGFVVEYNTEAVYGAGSAIFFHVGYNATAGCIAASEDMVLAYLATLDPQYNPYILIG